MDLRLSLMASALLALAAGCGPLAADELEIGAQGPDFSAVGVDDEGYTLASAEGAKAVVVCFTCNNCPVAVAYEDRLIELANSYKDKGVTLIALNCNNGTEEIEAMKKRAADKAFPFPYAFDASGDAARSYGARVTPHIFVLDGDRKVAYRGAFDDDMVNPTTPHLANALDAILAGEAPKVASTEAKGCAIKLKQGSG